MTNDAREDHVESPAGAPEPLDRPTGVAVLGVLHFVGAIAIVAVALLAPRVGLDEAGQSAAEYAGMSLGALIAGVGVLATIFLLSGVGLWFGKRWGWWAAS